MTTTQSWTLEDLEYQVLAACLHDTAVLEQVNVRYKSRLTGRNSSLFQAANVYYSITRGLLTRDALAQMLMQNEPDLEKHDDYLALYDTLTSPPYTDYSEENRRWFLHEYDVQWQVNQTGEVLARAAEAMRVGHTSHGVKMVGADAAWQVIAEERISFLNNTSATAVAEAEASDYVEQAKLDYSWAAEHQGLTGIPLALPEVNDKIAGLQAGDLLFITAFASEGKSFMMLNDGYAAWKAGKNVSIATSEMKIKKYYTRLISLHSCDPKFGYSEPLLTTEIRSGTLSKENHERFLEVLADIKARGDGKYGRLFMFQFPYRATPSFIFNKFAGYDQIVPLDFGIIDYLGLLASEQRRVQRREELDDLIRDCKSLALDFRSGSGLAVEVGYQTNRQSFEKARMDGYYTLSCFAESSEAEKSADAALWLLSQPQNPAELKAGFIKNRDDELGEPFFVRRAFQYAKIDSLQSSRARQIAPGAGLLEL